MRPKCQREKCILVPPVWKLELSKKFCEHFHNFIEIDYGLPLVIDFEDKYPDIRWTQCKSAQYLN